MSLNGPVSLGSFMRRRVVSLKKTQHRSAGRQGEIGNCVVAIALSLLAAIASAEPLVIESVTDSAEYRRSPIGQWEPLSKGSSLTLPVEVRTLDNSEAELSQSGSSIVLKPNTRLSFASSATEETGLITRVKQWIGTAFYKIERQPDEFSVETPFLVSTVKGTQFVIVSTEADTFVTLTEGSLKVLDLETGSSQMIVPGEIAGSSAGQPSARTYNKQKPKATAQSAAGGGAGMSSGKDNPVVPATQSPSKNSSASSQAKSPGQAEVPGNGMASTRGVENAAGRAADRRPVKDRGRGFAAALEAIDEVRAEQNVTRDERSKRPLTIEDIKAARDNVAKSESGGGGSPRNGRGGNNAKPDNAKPDNAKPDNAKPGADLDGVIKSDQERDTKIKKKVKTKIEVKIRVERRMTTSSGPTAGKSEC